jgi:hypothetical protein
MPNSLPIRSPVQEQIPGGEPNWLGVSLPVAPRTVFEESEMHEPWNALGTVSINPPSAIGAYEDEVAVEWSICRSALFEPWNCDVVEGETGLTYNLRVGDYSHHHDNHIFARVTVANPVNSLEWVVQPDGILTSIEGVQIRSAPYRFGPAPALQEKLLDGNPSIVIDSEFPWFYANPPVGLDYEGTTTIQWFVCEEPVSGWASLPAHCVEDYYVHTDESGIYNPSASDEVCGYGACGEYVAALVSVNNAYGNAQFRTDTIRIRAESDPADGEDAGDLDPSEIFDALEEPSVYVFSGYPAGLKDMWGTSDQVQVGETLTVNVEEPAGWSISSIQWFRSDTVGGSGDEVAGATARTLLVGEPGYYWAEAVLSHPDFVDYTWRSAPILPESGDPERDLFRSYAFPGLIWSLKPVEIRNFTAYNDASRGELEWAVGDQLSPVASDQRISGLAAVPNRTWTWMCEREFGVSEVIGVENNPIPFLYLTEDLLGCDLRVVLRAGGEGTVWRAFEETSLPIRFGTEWGHLWTDRKSVV